MKGEESKHIFGISGPTHLTSVDWRIREQRSSVAASLVQGVYVLERDRQKKRVGNKALAPIWWDFFHFKRIEILVDEVDNSVFGAIFEYKRPRTLSYSHDVPPRYVIAFRGTINKCDTLKRDLYLDVGVLPLNRLSGDTRYKISFEAVTRVITELGSPASVWLAGHSLGAAIALQVGRDMAKERVHIETYLFNPPFYSFPIEKLKNEELETRIQIASSVVTAGLSFLTKGCPNKNSEKDMFRILSPWIPFLFVNPFDPICNGYIRYFEHRERMEGWGFGDIESIATKDSIISLISAKFGGDGEASHLIPSAIVTKNMSNVEQSNLNLTHAINQWWNPNPYYLSKSYKWDDN